MQVREERFINLIPDSPVFPPQYTVDSISHTDAEVLQGYEELRKKTYEFHEVSNWFEIGLQALTREDWRPDCVFTNGTNTGRALPPPLRVGTPLVFGALALTKYLPEKAVEEIEELMNAPVGEPYVEVKTFSIKGMGVSCSYVRTPDHEVSAQGWIFGIESHRALAVEAPKFVGESAAVNALSLVKDFLERLEASPGLVTVCAGEPALCRHLNERCNTGRMNLTSQAAPEIRRLCHKIAQKIPCPLIFNSAGAYDDYYPRLSLNALDPFNSIASTKIRLMNQVLRSCASIQASPIRRIPLTHDEIKARVFCQHEKDEAGAIKSLTASASVSGAIFSHFRLDRTIIKEALSRYGHSRALQSTLCSIICATRFKYFEKGHLLSTLRQYVARWTAWRI